jgi:hypothetical protein
LIGPVSSRDLSIASSLVSLWRTGYMLRLLKERIFLVVSDAPWSRRAVGGFAYAGAEVYVCFDTTLDR